MNQVSDLIVSYKQLIIESWKQCTANAINPDLPKAPKITPKEFSIIRQKRRHLYVHTFQSIINRFSPFIDWSEYIIALTDENGIILFLDGSVEKLKEAKGYGFDVGTHWAEESVGTNAIGSSLANGQPICVIGEDHFVNNLKKYSCAASPIRDPLSGEIIGALNLSCREEKFHIFSLCIVEALTEILESNLYNISNKHAYNLPISLKESRFEKTEIVGLKDISSHPIYVSDSMSKIVNRAKKVAQFDLTKLILGESGVGKEVLAKFIHENGPRAAQPFIALNCSAIPKELLASELYGYESGAFTGARLKGKPGIFQQANHGTIYLDEIGDMPLELQSYLLRIIEEKKVTRLGGTEALPIDVQIIASTNRDLKKLVEENKFRLDLYYRLNVIVLVILPLRERKDDILPLSQYFLEKSRRKLDVAKKKLAPEVIDAFHNYNWPGNIRELEHVIEMAHAISNKDVIDLPDLPEDILADHSGCNKNFYTRKPMNAEDEKIKMTIKICAGNISKTAQVLNISRMTLYRKMRKYGIPLGCVDHSV